MAEIGYIDMQALYEYALDNLGDWAKAPVPSDDADTATYHIAEAAAHGFTADSVTEDDILYLRVMASSVVGLRAVIIRDFIQSADYDGTDFLTADATDGYRIDEDGIEAANLRARGELEAVRLSSSASSANVMPNGTLETDATGWSSGTRSSTKAHSGTWSYQDPGTDVIYQTAALVSTEGKMYRVTFWVNPNSTATVNLLAGESADQFPWQQSCTALTWTQGEAYFFVPAGDDIRLQWQASVVEYVDDVQIFEVGYLEGPFGASALDIAYTTGSRATSVLNRFQNDARYLLKTGTAFPASLLEALQDAVGAMFTGNDELGVDVTYQDSDGTIDVEAKARVAQTRRTAGDVASASTSYVDVTAMSATVAAKAGDWLEIGASGRWGNQAVTKRLDAMTTTGSNYCSGDGSGGLGVAAWGGITSATAEFGGSIMYQVVSGDISGGNVAVKLRMKMSAGVSGTLTASSPILEMWVRNHGS